MTGLRFDYGTLPGGAGFHPNNYDRMDIDLDLVDASTVTVGELITNCANQSGNEVGGTDVYDSDSCDDIEIEEPDAEFYLWDWDWTGTSPYDPGETVRLGFTLGVEWDNGIPLVNPTIASLLPEGFTYQGNVSIDGDAWTEAGSPAYTVDVIDDFGGTTQQLVRITFPGGLTIPATGVEKEFWMGFDMLVEPDAHYGYHESEIFGSWDSPADGDGVNWIVDDTLDYDGDGDTSDRVGKDREWFLVGDPGGGIASLDTVMGVKGELDTGYSQFPDSGLTTPAGQADYQLTITNSGGTALKDLVVIEILPHVGDHGVIDLSPRNSEWAPFLVAAVAAPAGIDVYYSTSATLAVMNSPPVFRRAARPPTGR